LRGVQTAPRGIELWGLKHQSGAIAERKQICNHELVRRQAGSAEGADRNADHVIDPLVAEAALESWPRKNRGTGLHIG
jgi:hypothetical protein